jgi:hypothetical protein
MRKTRNFYINYLKNKRIKKATKKIYKIENKNRASQKFNVAREKDH